MLGLVFVLAVFDRGTEAQITAAALLPSVQDSQRGWATAQERLAQLSSNSGHRTAHGSTHSALLEEERFASITTRAITELFAPPAPVSHCDDDRRLTDDCRRACSSTGG
jgi:hypothetical protein